MDTWILALTVISGLLHSGKSNCLHI